MIKNLYNQKYFQRYAHYLKRDLTEIPLFAKIGEWVTREKPKKVLDVGCGLGYLLAWLVGKTGAEGWGIDSSKIAISRAKKAFSGIKFTRGKAQKLPFKNRLFDFVLLVNLIEHLTEKEQKQVLIETKRVLKNKGVLILSTPSPTSLYARLMIHDPTHQKELKREELLGLVRTDFELEELVLTNSIGRFGRKLNFFLSALFPADLVLKLRKKNF